MSRPISTTVVTGLVRAPRAEVYRALLDPEALARWRVPDDMRSEVHALDPREGGRFRVSLTYDDPARAGKSAGATDTYTGHFARLVPGVQVVEVLAFESDDAATAAPMTMTTTLRDADEGTEVEIRHEGLPDSVAPADNEAGTMMALARLAAFVEGAAGPAGWMGP